MFMRYFPVLVLLLACPMALPDENDGKMEITKIAPGVFMHTSYGYLPDYGYYPSNGLIVIEGQRAYIIDTPWPERDTDTLLAWIESRGYSATASLSTHFHDDRASGIAVLNARGVATHASARTNALLREQDRPTATHAFTADHHVLLPGRIEAFYPGPGHTRDNIVVWLPRERLLFGGCLVRELATRSMGNTADGSLADWPHSIEKVRQTFPQVLGVIPGHGPPGGEALLTHTQELARQ